MGPTEPLSQVLGNGVIGMWPDGHTGMREPTTFPKERGRESDRIRLCYPQGCVAVPRVHGGEMKPNMDAEDFSKSQPIVREPALR